MLTLRHKRGDTFVRAVTVYSGVAPYDLGAATVRCQIRRGRGQSGVELVQELTVVESLVDVGKFTISATATETALWPTGMHLADIQITIGAGVLSTKTFTVDVVEDITR